MSPIAFSVTKQSLFPDINLLLFPPKGMTRWQQCYGMIGHYKQQALLVDFRITGLIHQPACRLKLDLQHSA